MIFHIFYSSKLNGGTVMTTSGLDHIFSTYAKPIIESVKIDFLRTQTQHGSSTCYDHCVSVAKTSILIAEKLHIRYDKKALVRGALLHDYFLYDWHLTHERWHGFRHPYIALSNASRDFDLTAREKNIIVRHMFPLTPIPPKYRESLLVSTADKICALKEVFVGISNYFRCHQRLTQALLRACTILITILPWTH